MRVAICTTNQSIMLNMVSMVAKDGCKFTKIKKYTIQDIKGHDICIFDLDNLNEYYSFIKSDASKMSEIILIGISGSDEILDTFRPLMNVEKKPFSLDCFHSYKDQVVENIGSELIVNKDIERVYDAHGINISSSKNEASLTDEDRLNLLKRELNESHANIKNESEIFKNIGINDLKVPEFVPFKSFEIDESKLFEDGALLSYRTRKLKKLNLSAIEIEQKLKELSDRQYKNSNNYSKSNEFLERLKSGYFKSKQPEQKKIDIPASLKPKEEHVVEEKIPNNEIIKEVNEVKNIEDKYLISENTPVIEKSIISEITSTKIEVVEKDKDELDRISKNETEQKNTDIRDTILDVKLSPEKEALLKSKIDRIKELRKNSIVKTEEPVNIQKTSDVCIEQEKKSQSNNDNYAKSETEKIIEENNKSQEEIPSKYLLDDSLEYAKARMTAGQNTKENIQSEKLIKLNEDGDLKGSLPTTSLFDTLKEAVSQIGPREDLVTKKKEFINKKTKPPKR